MVLINPSTGSDQPHYVTSRLSAGVSGAAVSTAIGVPWQTVSRWLGEARSSGPRLVPVELAAPAPVLTVRSPRGFVVEGLDLEAVAELLARLG